MWLDARLSETVTFGRGKSQQTRPKYTLDQLVADPEEAATVTASQYRSDWDRFG